MHFVARAGQGAGHALRAGPVRRRGDGRGRRLLPHAGQAGLHPAASGPGLANGLANLHNAKKANSGIVNIVGEHATYHIAYDAPLTSDIEGVAAPMSHWVKTSPNARTIAADGALAIQAARQTPGQIATLILPADTAWGAADGIAETAPPAAAAEGLGRCRQGGRRHAAQRRARNPADGWRRPARTLPGAGGADRGQDRLRDSDRRRQHPAGARRRPRARSSAFPMSSSRRSA